MVKKCFPIFKFTIEPGLVKLFLLFTICILCCVNAYSQGGGRIWYFGHFAGIDFSSGTAVAITNGKINTNEGSSSISDCYGKLLSYTDGVTVYDAAHNIMPNGTGLFGGASSAQSALYVPKPCSKDSIYLFTAAAFLGFGGISYSIIDMSQNAGMGDVISKNNNLYNSATERLTGIRHANGVDYWVITHDWQNNNFVEYEVTNAGISAPITISIGSSIGSASQFIGVAKFSPNGKKLAVTVYGNGSSGWVDLYDFNTTTGALSNRMVLDTSAVNYGFYGASFSPDNSLLYISRDSPGSIYQYNLNAGTPALVQASKTLIGTSGFCLGHLQLGPDGKIYAALGCGAGSDSLGVIKNPNVLGVGCNYTGKSFYLGPMVAGWKRSALGLPTTIESYYDTTLFANAWPTNTTLCAGGNVQLNASGGTVYRWSPTTGLSNPNIANPIATPAGTSSYTVSIYDPCNALCDTIKKIVTITVNTCGCSITAQASTIANISCNGTNNGSANVLISSGAGGPYTYNWSNGSGGTTTVTTIPITGLSAATYTVTITEGSCTSTSTVTIMSPPALAGQFIKGTGNCNGCGCKEWIMVTATGGTSPYSYSWPDGYVNRYKNRFCPGIYTINIIDKNGCSVNINLSAP